MSVVHSMVLIMRQSRIQSIRRGRSTGSFCFGAGDKPFYPACVIRKQRRSFLLLNVPLLYLIRERDYLLWRRLNPDKPVSFQPAIHLVFADGSLRTHNLKLVGKIKGNFSYSLPGLSKPSRSSNRNLRKPKFLETDMFRKEKNCDYVHLNTLPDIFTCLGS